jgi:DNA-directed RNA polymerase sigma subunit (sigma70/sigma32)
MPELAALLQEITDALVAVHDRESDLTEARRELGHKIRRAHNAGASYELIGKLIGVSRQRAAQLAERGD